MGKFEISIRSNGRHQFNLVADNGQVILTSQGYSSRAACEKGVASVVKNGVNDFRYERNRSSDNKFYFNLKSGNGKVVGTSEMYESSASMENGIDSVKRNLNSPIVAEAVAV